MIQPHRTKKDQRVKLLPDGQDGLYPFACAGSEGWVRRLDHDPQGYPIVFVEWDKDHWAYNGESDRWTFEAHFEPVKEDMREDNADLFKEFLKFMQENDISFDSEDESPKVKNPKNPEMPRAEVFKIAVDSMEKSDSFLLIYIDREAGKDNEPPLLVPYVVNYYNSIEGGLLLEAQLSKFAAISHEELTIQAIREALGDEGIDES